MKDKLSFGRISDKMWAFINKELPDQFLDIYSWKWYVISNWSNQEDDISTISWSFVYSDYEYGGYYTIDTKPTETILERVRHIAEEQVRQLRGNPNLIPLGKVGDAVQELTSEELEAKWGRKLL